ncbi:hypothetical protein FEO85_03285 [Stenotrophomonas maltophilia]|nr:hypothetical protein FEO85_03285 [Stenotrophomonas maltophilia]
MFPCCRPAAGTTVEHPRMAWIYCRSRKSVGGGVGPVAGVSAAWMPRPSPQGRVYGVPRHRTHPAIPREPRFMLWPLLLLLLLLLLLPWPRRVPGAARPKPFPRFRYNVGPVSQLRFPGHDGPRGRARPVAVPPRTS